MFRKLANSIGRKRFRYNLAKTENREFTIISSNCFGSLFYKKLGLSFNTPTINLFFYPPCYIKLIKNLKGYFDSDLEFVDESMYPEGNINRKEKGFYPLGRILDIEIHFLHYRSLTEAKSCWNRRKERVDYDNLFYMFTDKGLRDIDLLKEFDSLPLDKKVCFTSSHYKEINSAVYLPKYSGENQVGNIIRDYNALNGHFDFASWVNS